MLRGCICPSRCGVRGSLCLPSLVGWLQLSVDVERITPRSDLSEPHDDVEWLERERLREWLLRLRLSNRWPIAK